RTPAARRSGRGPDECGGGHQPASRPGCSRGIFVMGAPDVQARIYRDLSVSLAAFYRATEGIGAAKRVTTYTDFDFGAQAASRTQIVLGASVLGGAGIPTRPRPRLLTNNMPEHWDRGSASNTRCSRFRASAGGVERRGGNVR